MDNITLAWLTEADACSEARTAFVNIFGEAGEPTPHEVFTAAAKLNRRDWTSWLIQNVPGILAGLSITDGPIKAVGSGTIEVNDGYVYAYGSATVEAYGSATVEAYGSATVEAYDSATVEAYGSATVEAYGSATVKAYTCAAVYAYDSATVYAYGSATVKAYDSATVKAYDSATVEAYGSATVKAYDSATVYAYGSATVLLGWYSRRVTLSIVGPNACALDRRDGPPRLILADTTTEQSA